MLNNLDWQREEFQNVQRKAEKKTQSLDTWTKISKWLAESDFTHKLSVYVPACDFDLVDMLLSNSLADLWSAL